MFSTWSGILQFWNRSHPTAAQLLTDRVADFNLLSAQKNEVKISGHLLWCIHVHNVEGFLSLRPTRQQQIGTDWKGIRWEKSMARIWSSWGQVDKPFGLQHFHTKLRVFLWTEIRQGTRILNSSGRVLFSVRKFASEFGMRSGGGHSVLPRFIPLRVKCRIKFYAQGHSRGQNIPNWFFAWADVWVSYLPAREIGAGTLVWTLALSTCYIRQG